MMRPYRVSPKSSPASSAGFSSPALPELSLDASLQRLHQDEELSSASKSSLARSQAWLHAHSFEQDSERSSSPETFHRSHPSLDSLGSSSVYRFPKVTSDARPPSQSHDAQPQEPALPARPRTSRGLSEPKPFLSSSSRTTSIASIAEIVSEPAQQVPHPTISFGTPFADHAFEHRFHDPDNELAGQPGASRSSSSSPERVNASFRATHTTRLEIAGEIHDLEASTDVPASAASSQWTILFAPTSKDGSSSTPMSEATFLLPLLESMEDQAKLLKHHLSKQPASGTHGNPNSGYARDSSVNCFLDLSAVSTLDPILAQLTPQSWPIVFRQYLFVDSVAGQRESVPNGGNKAAPLPLLARETGLPIVALVRYTLLPATTPSPLTKQNLRDAQTVPPAASKRTLLDKPGAEASDSRSWTRRESEMTVSLANAGTAARSTGMAASRSYPGHPRTPVRKSPLPYSPRAMLFPTDRPSLGAAMMPRDFASNNITHRGYARLGSAENKLRSLSLAAAHPLVTEGEAMQMQYADPQSPKSKGKPSGLTGAQDQQESVALDSQQHTRCLGRGDPQSSRGSSHKSYPSHGTSLSTHSTRSTSLYSIPSHNHPADADDSDTDSDDLEVGRHFWTQLSNLGEQITREKDPDRPQTGFSSGRNVSISSEASSVFDFSPLGILVPEPRTEVSRPAISAVVASQPSVLSRRRAYSSMVPLTGWRAGDTDLSTAHDVDTIRQLPHVLLLEPRDSAEHCEITPTVTTFQGRARAHSFQPASWQTERRTGVDAGQRQDVWQEAMHQLQQRVSQDSRLITHLQRNDEPGIGDHPEAVDTEPPRSEEAFSPPVDSSPLPGLFYEHWVERTDLGVDGELGRRGSALHLAPEAPVGGTSPASSGLTMLGSASNSDSPLQALDNWPVPHSRPPPVTASQSFLSVASPVSRQEDAASVCDMVRSGSSPLPTAFAPMGDVEGWGMAGWAQLAQRLESPGSMRLLCLAASSLPSNRPPVESSFSPKAGGEPPRKLVRKKAALLGPIRISPTRNEEGEGIHSDGEHACEQPRGVTRMRRSLSNIFDLPQQPRRSDT
ncbi:uncharacterized protein PSANT_06054 [Moesziomyces antarcticus]|nr:uncharacterized protein PSANT_06054 [Moesziomyces antarcticus]